MTMVEGIDTGRAFLMGAGLVGVSPKLWAFTLGAIGAIQDAHMDPAAGWLVYVIWVVLAEALRLLALLLAVVTPARADVLLGRAGDALVRYSRLVMIGVSLVFGVWFLLKALAVFGFGSASLPASDARPPRCRTPPWTRWTYPGWGNAPAAATWSPGGCARPSPCECPIDRRP